MPSDRAVAQRRPGRRCRFSSQTGLIPSSGRLSFRIELLDHRSTLLFRFLERPIGKALSRSLVQRHLIEARRLALVGIPLQRAMASFIVTVA